MKRKIFSVLLTLVLVLSFSMVTAVPAAATDPSTFIVSGGTYTTAPTGELPYRTGTISANLAGEWDSAVIGEFTAAGVGGLYVVDPIIEPQPGSTAGISVSGTLSEFEIAFTGVAVWVEGDDITDDEVTGIAGTITIQPDGAFDAELTGDIAGGYTVDIDMTGLLWVAAAAIDLAVNDLNPWTDGAFTFENISPGGALMEFDFKLHNVGVDPGVLTFEMSYVENDMDGAPYPNMSADEFASLIYVEDVHYQFKWPADPEKQPGGYVGSVKPDLDSWLDMDSGDYGGNDDGKVSLYEICQVGPIQQYDPDGGPLNAGAEITYFIKFQLGDSLDPFQAGGAIQIGGEDNSSRGDGISVTVSATLEEVEGSLFDTEESSGNVFQALGVAGPVLNVDTDVSYGTIQLAINDASPDDTIVVEEGEYAGAIVNEDLNIIGAAGGASIITSGVPYKLNSPLLTGFRLDDGADGAEIRNFTMNGTYNTAGKFWFAVFARNADSVIVDSLALNDMVQGITNWGGSGWEITNNGITQTYPTYGGGIAIYLGADPTNFPHCDNNLVQGNTISTSVAQDVDFTGAAICLWFDEREGVGYPKDEYTPPIDKTMTGNEIIDNSITASGLENQVGIEIGVGGLDGDLGKVADCLGVIHDNTVTNNTIDNAEWGLNLYVTTNLTVSGNTIKNCSDCGIYMKDDHANCLINYNDIYGNINYGLNNTDGAAYERTVDASKNYWGDPSGPDGAQVFVPGQPATYTGVLPGTGNKVSAKVQSMPWLTRPFETVIEDDIAYFGVSFPALKGWNIVSAPLALDAYVKEANPEPTNPVDYPMNTWGGLRNLGKIDAGDDYALKLHYTEDDSVRTYTPIWYYDSDPDSPEVGWRQATADTKINPVDAFYIRMMESDSFPVLFSPDLSVPSKKLDYGWNLVGCAYMDIMFADNLPLLTALATIAEVSSPAGDVKGYAQVVSPPVNQKPWIFIPIPEGDDIYIPPSSAGETILMGKGYWLFMENPGTLAGLTFTPMSLPKP